ncbi:hypothetical protein N8684_00745 [bacterium]|nr:hypothetical protein [bacterium]
MRFSIERKIQNFYFNNTFGEENGSKIFYNWKTYFSKMDQKSSTILNELIEEISRLLPDLMEAFYAYGSIKWEDFNPERSDLNCIIISSNKPDEQQTKMLESIHRLIYKRHKYPFTYTIYLTWDDLGKSKEAIGQFLYFFAGKLQSKELCGLNALTWWQLKQNSITLLGKEAKALNFDIKENEIIDFAYANMHNDQKDLVGNCSSFWSWYYWVFIYSDKFFEWSISEFTRQYYILKNKDVPSMHQSMKYCLESCPPHFQNILKEVIRIRRGEKGTIYPSKWFRRKEGLEFMNYIINECDRPVENFYL